MKHIERVTIDLQNISSVVETEDGLRISTQCLYASNSSVCVAVRGGGDEFVISDDGGALGEIRSSGLQQQPTDRQISSLIKNLGLKVKDGVIYSPRVSLEAIPFASIIVANAAKTVADWGLDHLRFAVPRNFRRDLTELLQRHFHDNMKDDQPVVGASNKPHRFGHVIYLENQKRLLIDPVINDSSSINSRVVANLDVKMTHNPLIEQIIIYDDRMEWTSSDLKLLQVGATIVPFSTVGEEIQRLAA